MNVWSRSSQERPPRDLWIDLNEASINASANFSVKYSAFDAAEDVEVADKVDSFEKFRFAGIQISA